MGEAEKGKEKYQYGHYLGHDFFVVRRKQVIDRGKWTLQGEQVGAFKRGRRGRKKGG